MASNWTTSSSTHVVPANGDDAVLGTPAGISSVNFNASYSSPGLNSLTINAVSVATFTLNQTTAGTAMVAVNETLGTNEYGNIYNQTAGTITPSSGRPPEATTSASARSIRPTSIPTRSIRFTTICMSPNTNAYSNYNGLQIGLTRQQGHGTFSTNYTFSKASAY